MIRKAEREVGYISTVFNTMIRGCSVDNESTPFEILKRYSLYN